MDESRGDGRAVVVQHRRELPGYQHRLGNQQRAKLAVAVLLHHEHVLVRGHEIDDLVVERECADAQGIDVHGLVVQQAASASSIAGAVEP